MSELVAPKSACATQKAPSHVTFDQMRCTVAPYDFLALSQGSEALNEITNYTSLNVPV